MLSRVESIRQSKYAGVVYNLEVEEDNSYATECFVVHNCDPSRAENKFFDVDRIEEDMKRCREPKYVIGGVKYWGRYLPHHFYGLGSDHSEGIGIDANTMCLWDFYTGEIVATQANNHIAPDLHADECMRVGNEFGACVWAPEVNNKCGGTVLTVAQTALYPNLFKQKRPGAPGLPDKNTVGWMTTHASKITMYMDFRRDYNDGKIIIYDLDLLKEMKAYSNSDLVEEETVLVTRHFDLLTGAVIGWQTRKTAMLIGGEPTEEELEQAEHEERHVDDPFSVL